MKNSSCWVLPAKRLSGLDEGYFIRDLLYEGVEYHPVIGGKRYAKVNFLLREKNCEANEGNHRGATQKLFSGQVVIMAGSTF